MKAKPKPAPSPEVSQEIDQASPQSDEETAQQPMPEKSFISKNITVTGDVVSEGELSIEGVIKGNVHSFMIILGKQGRIEGDLVGDSIAVRGAIAGNIRGSEVNLFEGCEVQGNIVHEKLYIENGAMFEGQIKRLNSTAAPQAQMPEKQAAMAPEPAAANAGVISQDNSGPTQKKTPKKTRTSNSEKNPVIVKDVAMIMSGDASAKK